MIFYNNKIISINQWIYKTKIFAHMVKKVAKLRVRKYKLKIREFICLKFY